MERTINCPHCKQTVTAERIGNNIICSDCREIIDFKTGEEIETEKTLVNYKGHAIVITLKEKLAWGLVEHYSYSIDGEKVDKGQLFSTKAVALEDAKTEIHTRSLIESLQEETKKAFDDEEKSDKEENDKDGE